MYTVSKGPSKIVAKTRRGLSQNFEKFETIKESGKQNKALTNSATCKVPRPVFHSKKYSNQKAHEQPMISAYHEEIIKYINDSWNMLVAENSYDCNSADDQATDANNNNSATSSQCKTYNNENSNISNNHSNNSDNSDNLSEENNNPSEDNINNNKNTSSSNRKLFYCNEPPSPILSDFKPFDLELWWGRRLFHNITKNL